MIWKKPPHLPEPGSRIIAKYKGCKIGNYFELQVREGEGLAHIEKWVYIDEYKNYIKKELKK